MGCNCSSECSACCVLGPNWFAWSRQTQKALAPKHFQLQASQDQLLHHYNLKNCSSNQWLGYFRKAKHLHKGDFSRLLKDDVLQLTFENERLDMVLSGNGVPRTVTVSMKLTNCKCRPVAVILHKFCVGLSPAACQSPFASLVFSQKSHCMMLTACSFDKLWLTVIITEPNLRSCICALGTLGKDSLRTHNVQDASFPFIRASGGSHLLKLK